VLGSSERPLWSAYDVAVLDLDGVVYVGSWDRNLYAIDAATGNKRWAFETGQDTVIYNQVGINSSAAVSNGIVFFGARDGHFYAVDARSGHLHRGVLSISGVTLSAAPCTKTSPAPLDWRS